MYDGSECTAIFGHASIYSSPAIIRTRDAVLRDYYFSGNGPANLDFFSDSTSCKNFVRFTLCLQYFPPCPGTVYCGSSSKEALKTAAATACSCVDADFCTVGVYDVSQSIDTMSYYEGSSATEILDYNRNDVTCQDVTSGEKCVWMYYMFMHAHAL